jgi:hypothetical protein
MLQRSHPGRRPMRSPDGHDGDAPVGICLAVGALGVVVACLLAAAVPASDPVARWCLVVATIGAYAVTVADLGSAVFLALTAFMIFNGFVTNSTGDLSWHGVADTARLATVFGAVVFGSATGRIYRRARRVATTRNRDGATSG